MLLLKPSKTSRHRQIGQDAGAVAGSIMPAARNLPGCIAGALSEEKTRHFVDAELVLDLGGVSLNDETTSGFSGRLDPAQFVSLGLNDVRIGEQVFGNVRLADTNQF
jgi:TPP-dependent 2-oxoacid decarboxylase